MNHEKMKNWLKQHTLILEESFCDRKIVEEYKEQYGYKTMSEVYRLMGISRQQIAYWAANPYSTQTKKTVFDSIKSSRDFLLI